jgi:hypothetical protein
MIEMGMQHSYITKACKPLGLLPEGGKVQPIQYPDGPIATLYGHNSAYRRVIQHLLEVCCPHLIITGKLVIRCSNGLPEPDLKSPGFQQCLGWLNCIHADLPGCAENTNGVTSF